MQHRLQGKSVRLGAKIVKLWHDGVVLFGGVPLMILFAVPRSRLLTHQRISKVGSAARCRWTLDLPAGPDMPGRHMPVSAALRPSRRCEALTKLDRSSQDRDWPWPSGRFGFVRW